MVTPHDYEIEVDQTNCDEWTSLLQDFADAVIYQTWSYGAVRWGESNLSHIVLKRRKKIVAAAQVRILTMPVVNCGIAYIPWGPIWRVRGEERSLDDVHHFVKALRTEYVSRRGLHLRVLPSEVANSADAEAIRSIFATEGFRESTSPSRTIHLDLTPTMEELRRNLSSRWRRQLNLAEKKGLSIVEGTETTLYETFRMLYDEMLTRKQFVPGMDVNGMKTVQQDLPESLKMRIMVCVSEGEPVSAIVGSLLGDTGIYLLGATGDKGLKLRGSYLLHWRMVEWLKERGARWYDLNGFNPEKNPGTASFKAGMSGKDVHHIGQFDACQNFASAFVVASGDYVRMTTQKMLLISNQMKKKFLQQDSESQL